jgi:hypothetical protein
MKTTACWFLLLATLLASALAQSPMFTLIAGKTDADGFPLTGASFCLESAKGDCFQMPDLRNSDVTYQFGLEPHARNLPQTGTTPWFLFDAMFSGGGSGTLTRYAILSTDNGHIVNLLPDVALTNASEYAIWTNLKLSPYPIVVTADFDWDMAAGETHFAKHHYFVSVWRFDPKRNVYIKALTYRTAKKYDSLDDADTINVIAPERPEILRRLTNLIPNP